MSKVDIQKIARIQKRFYEGSETPEDINWIFKELSQIANLKLDLKKMRNDNGRSEYLIQRFAYSNKLNDFRDKWSNKNFNNLNYNLSNQIEDLLQEINKLLPESKNTWF